MSSIWLFQSSIFYNEPENKCFSEFCELLEQIIKPEEGVMSTPDL